VITNQRQYDITTAALDRFGRALAALRESADDVGEDAHRLRRIHEAGILSEIDALKAQLAEYDALRSGAPATLRIESFDELPVALVKARIAAGLTEHQLAERLGVAAGQVERDEASDYHEASFAYVAAVAAALGLKLGGAIALPAGTHRAA
jgi:hypothetical protein